MAGMQRVRVTWDGLGGLPGLSTFYYAATSPAVADLTTFFSAIKGQFPTPLTWTIPSTGDVIDNATGALLGTWTGTGGGTVAATGAASQYAAGTGLRVRWLTGQVHNGRRVAGSTFLCPVITNTYSLSGSIDPTKLSIFTAAAAAYVAAAPVKLVWSRGRTPGDGVSVNINSYDVPNRVSSLRSRRY